MRFRRVEPEVPIQGILEALLFVADQPLSAPRLAEIAGTPLAETVEALGMMAQRYKEDGSGWQLREVGGGYRLYTHPAYASYVEKLVVSGEYRKLTAAALETLAIVAYLQPVTRSEISAIRGVAVEGVLASLVAKELIKEVGRETTPGQPIIYGTTKRFLEAFGLNEIRDLPGLEEFAPDEETRRQIEEKLSTAPPRRDDEPSDGETEVAAGDAVAELPGGEPDVGDEGAETSVETDKVG